jgi:hypothetical protein
MFVLLPLLPSFHCLSALYQTNHQAITNHLHFALCADMNVVLYPFQIFCQRTIAGSIVAGSERTNGLLDLASKNAGFMQVMSLPREPGSV